MRIILTFVISISTVALLAGCGADTDGSSSNGASVNVVASTTQLGDLARNVVGEEGTVTQILSANSDPHEYEPTPSDAESLIDADLILKSGGDLDPWLDQVVESSGSDAPVLTLIDDIDTRELDGETDPHWWQNPANAIVAVEAIRDELIAIDPDAKRAFTDNARAYIGELTDLDEQIQACIDSVPAGERKLVTSHDALGYYADRYGIDVIGAAIPALSTQAQASAGETTDLIDLIQRENVSTIYSEAGVSPELEQAIADQAGAEVGGELWADALGPEGSDGATYIEALASNTAKLVDGFSDGRVTCSIDVRN